MTSPYTCDPISNVQLRAGSNAFAYSDGEGVELRLQHVIEKATDISSASAELASAINDWPSEYHLSSTRHNLLRPINIAPTHRVLELGCGCGAITRYLGETGATVVAVEGSKRRAQIAASRCRDLPNVTIYCDNLIDFVYEEKFDFVTLIGVLEYAPKFIESGDPVKSCLAYARSFLKDDGALVLAIENQLGLKYFNGCLEDHVGIPFYGINDLYGNTDPVTFGRRVLSEKLNGAGFSMQEFFYPFPDYKLPELILSEAAFSDTRLNVADLLHRAVAKDHSGQARRTFHEQITWRVITRNNLVPDLANSFLVLAATDQRHLPDIDRTWLARVYTAKRLPELATETVFRDCDTNIRVTKRSLYSGYAGGEANLLTGRLLHQLPSDEIYIVGNLCIGELQRLLARGAGIESVAHWAHTWIEKLCQNASYDSGEPMLDGNWLDAIPANYIWKPEGKLVQIDKEWGLSCAIPLTWVLIRGLINSIAVCPTSPILSRMTYRQVIERVLAISGFNIKLNDEVFVAADRYETALRIIVFGTKQPPHIISQILDKPAASAIGTMMIQDELLRLNMEIQRIKSTASWRITKPLRFLANLPSIILWPITRNKDENGH